MLFDISWSLFSDVEGGYITRQACNRVLSMEHATILDATSSVNPSVRSSPDWGIWFGGLSISSAICIWVVLSEPQQTTYHDTVQAVGNTQLAPQPSYFTILWPLVGCIKLSKQDGITNQSVRLFQPPKSQQVGGNQYWPDMLCAYMLYVYTVLHSYI